MGRGMRSKLEEALAQQHSYSDAVALEEQVRARLAALEQDNTAIPDGLCRQWWQAVGGVLAWHGSGHAPGPLPQEIANRLCFMAGDVGAGHLPELISKAMPKHKPGERPLIHACKHTAVAFVLAVQSGKVILPNCLDPFEVVRVNFGIADRKTVQRWVKNPQYREAAIMELAAGGAEEIPGALMRMAQMYRTEATTGAAIKARDRKRA